MFTIVVFPGSDRWDSSTGPAPRPRSRGCYCTRGRRWIWYRPCSRSSPGPRRHRGWGHSSGSGSDQWGDRIITIDQSEAGNTWSAGFPRIALRRPLAAVRRPCWESRLRPPPAPPRRPSIEWDKINESYLILPPMALRKFWGWAATRPPIAIRQRHLIMATMAMVWKLTLYWVMAAIYTQLALYSTESKWTFEVRCTL